MEDSLLFSEVFYRKQLPAAVGNYKSCESEPNRNVAAVKTKRMSGEMLNGDVLESWDVISFAGIWSEIKDLKFYLMTVQDEKCTQGANKHV